MTCRFSGEKWKNESCLAMQSGCKQKVSYGLSYIIMIYLFQNKNGGFYGVFKIILKWSLSFLKFIESLVIVYEGIQLFMTFHPFQIKR